MAEEIELKLLVATENIVPLQQFLDAHSSSLAARELVNIYFDTPDWLLQHNKCALRIRNAAGCFEQTFKTQGYKEQGIDIRGEWNWPVASAQLDLSKLNNAELSGQWPTEVEQAALQPRFETNFKRQLWQWNTSEAQVEVALDIGEVKAGHLVEPLVELELELQAGNKQALLDIMQYIKQHIELQPSSISKAERGYRLAQRLDNKR